MWLLLESSGHQPLALSSRPFSGGCGSYIIPRKWGQGWCLVTEPLAVAASHVLSHRIRASSECLIVDPSSRVGHASSLGVRGNGPCTIAGPRRAAAMGNTSSWGQGGVGSCLQLWTLWGWQQKWASCIPRKVLWPSPTQETLSGGSDLLPLLESKLTVVASTHPQNSYQWCLVAWDPFHGERNTSGGPTLLILLPPAIVPCLLVGPGFFPHSLGYGTLHPSYLRFFPQGQPQYSPRIWFPKPEPRHPVPAHLTCPVSLAGVCMMAPTDLAVFPQFVFCKLVAANSSEALKFPLCPSWSLCQWVAFPVCRNLSSFTAPSQGASPVLTPFSLSLFFSFFFCPSHICGDFFVALWEVWDLTAFCRYSVRIIPHEDIFWHVCQRKAVPCSTPLPPCPASLKIPFYLHFFQEYVSPNWGMVEINRLPTLILEPLSIRTNIRIYGT